MFRRLALTAALAVVASCSGPPTIEHQQAEAAIAAARDADAATYAPDEWRLAQTALAEYDAAVAERDYRQALRLALEARDNATAAVRQATENEREARHAATSLVADIETLIHNADERTSRPGLTRAAAARLRSDIASAQTALQKARAAIDDGRFLEATQTLTPVKLTLEESAARGHAASAERAAPASRPRHR